MSSPLVVIVGPTASGKSALAIKVAKKFNGEIICADSRTVYKGMNIGTAKPSEQDQTEVKHHLLDVVWPDQPFTVAQFKRLANAAIVDITARGKLPILVGGSGLYVDSIIFDYKFGEPANLQQRSQLSTMNIEQLTALCRANNIELPENHLNKRYLIRAIEIGGPIKQRLSLRSNTIVVGLTTEKAILAKNIEQRVKQMGKRGVIEEAKELGARYGWEVEAMKGNIYRIFREVAQGTTNEQQAANEAVKSDLRLVKKQLTWLKRNPHIIWGEPKGLLRAIEQFIKRYKP